MSGLWSGNTGLWLGTAGFWSGNAGLWSGSTGLSSIGGGADPFPGASLYLNMLSGSLDSRVTFSRGSNATLVDSTGRIVYAPANLLLRSEEFDNATWTKTAANAYPFDPATATYGSNVSGTLLNSAGWIVDGCTVTTNGAGLDFAFTGSNKFAYKGITVTAGRWYRFSVTVSGLAANILWSESGLSGSLFSAVNISSTTLTGYFFATTATPVFGIASFAGAGTTTVSSLSVNEVIGGLITAPNGAPTADTMVASAGVGVLPRIGDTSNPVLIAGVSYNASMYVKAGTYTFFQIYLNNQGGEWANFTLTGAGTATANGACTASIVAAGDGWYRVSMTYTAGGTDRRPFFAMAASGTATRAQSWNPAGTETLLIWGAQLEPVTYQTVPGPYVATTSAAYYGPRFDYNPVTLAPLGLLIEEARTNLALRSQEFDVSAVWGVGTNTVTANTTASPDGTTNADTLTATATGTGAFVRQVNAVAATTAYTTTCFFKKGTADFANITVFDGTDGNRYWFNLNTGAIASTAAVGAGFTGLSARIENYGNGWYRCSVTFTTRSVTTLNIFITFTDADASLTLTNGRTGFIYGAQLEAGSFATSYIPTVASQVTRNADVATMTGTNFSSWYNQPEGSWVAEWMPYVVTGTVVAQISAATNNDRFQLLNDNGGQIAVSTAGVGQGGIDAGTVAAGAVNRLAYAYRTNDTAASLNGGSSVADTTVTLPVVDRLCIGATVAPAGFLNGHIRQIAYFNTRLPNAQLQTLTAPPLTSPLFMNFTTGSYTVGY